MNEQEIAALNAKVQELTAQNQDLSTLKKNQDTLLAENKALKEAVAKKDHEAALATLALEFPEVPADLLPEGDLATKKAFAQKLSLVIKSKAGSLPKTPETPNPWEKAGSVQPSMDAATAAARADAVAKRKELVAKDDTPGLIAAIIGDNVDKVRRIFKLAPAK